MRGVKRRERRPLADYVRTAIGYRLAAIPTWWHCHWLTIDKVVSMDTIAHDFLKKILETPSPSGYEAPVQEIVRDYVSEFADEVSTDVHGNVIAVKNPGGPLRVMLAGHCDQIGLIVQYIDEQGFLYVQPIGGWDPQMLIGQRMTVWTTGGSGSRRDRPQADPPAHRRGTQAGRQAQGPVARHRRQGQGEAEGIIRVGDPVTVDLGYRELRQPSAYSPGMDDKTGLWVVIEALRRAEPQARSSAALYAVSTVQEEIGLRGAQTSAFGIDPHVGIAVDVTHATDCPTIEKKQEGDISLGKGPVIYRGPNMNPRRGRPADRAGREPQDSLSAGGQSAGRRPPTPTPSRSTAPAWRRRR